MIFIFQTIFFRVLQFSPVTIVLWSGKGRNLSYKNQTHFYKSLKKKQKSISIAYTLNFICLLISYVFSISKWNTLKCTLEQLCTNITALKKTYPKSENSEIVYKETWILRIRNMGRMQANLSSFVIMTLISLRSP